MQPHVNRQQGSRMIRQVMCGVLGVAFITAEVAGQIGIGGPGGQLKQRANSPSQTGTLNSIYRGQTYDGRPAGSVPTNAPRRRAQVQTLGSVSSVRNLLFNNRAGRGGGFGAPRGSAGGSLLGGGSSLITPLPGSSRTFSSGSLTTGGAPMYGGQLTQAGGKPWQLEGLEGLHTVNPGDGGYLDPPRLVPTSPVQQMLANATGWNPSLAASTLSLDAIEMDEASEGEESGAADVPLHPSKGIALEQLVQSHLDHQRKSFMETGWQYFKNREYRRACDEFSLAQRVTLDDPAARSEVQWGRMYSAIASKQYSLAVHELGWFIQQDPKTGKMRDQFCMLRVGDLSQRYGRAADYETHMRRVNEMIQKYPESTGFRALRMAMFWGIPENRGRARVVADQLMQMQGDQRTWGRFAQLMEIAASTTAPQSPPPLPASRSVPETLLDRPLQ